MPVTKEMIEDYARIRVEAALYAIGDEEPSERRRIEFSEAIDKAEAAIDAAIVQQFDSRWRDINSAPSGGNERVIVAVPNEHKTGWTVGEAYIDDQGEWWWAGTSADEYFDSPMSEANFHQPEFWQPLPEPPMPAVADIVPPHCTSSALVFELGVLHVNKDGSGYIVVGEDDFQLEDDRCEGPDGPEGSVHWIARFDVGGMTALRDFLNGMPIPPAPADKQENEGRPVA